MKIEKNKIKVTPLVLETYLAVIKNSVGSKMFRNFYAEVNGKPTDIMKNGDVSCAFFASSILVLFKLIKETHGTVDSTINDLKESGWLEIKKPKAGSVLIWEATASGKGECHKHIGFFVGNGRAISNSYKLGYPIKHHWNFNGKRRVEMILWDRKIK